MNRTASSSHKSRTLILLSIGVVSTVFIVFWILMRPHRQPDVKPIEEQFYSGGELKSRTEVVEGHADGLSQGWYTNGQLQVSEYFTNGISHGLRTKWYISGEKKTEAEIVSGRIHGRFRRWYQNGMLAEDAGYRNGIPHGISHAWHADGNRKSS